jgi:Zn-dependent protease
VWLALPALHTTFGEDCFGMLCGVNAVVALVNLVPYGPLDGREAWPLVAILVRRRLARRPAAALVTSARPPRREDMN